MNKLLRGISMQSSYQSIENHDKSFDLDEIIDMIGGYSTKREGWTG